MPLKLHAHPRIELRWWWEGSPAGEARRFRDRIAARRYLASVWAHEAHAAALRRFLHGGTPGLPPARDDDELLDRLATALAAGRVSIADVPRDVLPTWDEVREEEAAAPVSVPRAAVIPPAEEICWPCLRAAASARALREASADGAPFVAQD